MEMRNDGHNPLLPPDIHIPDGEAHVMPDGSIPEVRMTSQGPGAPYGSGETIPGWQVKSKLLPFYYLW